MEEQKNKLEQIGQSMEQAGKAMQGCGCMLFLIPILIGLLWFIAGLMGC
jgi:hypothetical protein